MPEPNVTDVADVVAAMNEIAASELDLPRPIAAGDDLVRDLCLDSLGLTVLVVGLEDRYRVRLSHDDAEGVKTAGDLARLVALRAAAGATNAGEGERASAAGDKGSGAAGEGERASAAGDKGSGAAGEDARAERPGEAGGPGATFRKDAEP